MVFNREYRAQYLAAFCVNILSVSNGAFCGWPSASFLVFQSPNSPLATGPMSNEIAGWVVSMFCLGGMPGAIISSRLAERIGRKWCTLLIAIPMIGGWLLIPFSTTPTHLAVSRFLGGLGSGASFGVIPNYITEISSDSIRGSLGTLLVLMCNLGILIAFIIGYFFTYITAAWMLVVIPVIFLPLFAMQPETPQFLLKQNKVEAAEKSLMYYRGIHRNGKAELEQLQIELEKLKGNEKPDVDDEKTSTWREFNTPIARKAMLISIVLMILNQSVGCFAMINYTGTIFKESGSSLSPNMSAIVVGLIQLMGSYFSTVLIERTGRKFLLLVSILGVGLGHVCLGAYMLLHSLGYDVHLLSWVPMASFAFLIFIGCVGMMPIPYLMMAEILPPKIRDMGSMICLVIMWTSCYLVLKYLPVVMAALGMHGLVFSFASTCFLGAIFIAFVVPETKGKSIDAIMALLEGV